MMIQQNHRGAPASRSKAAFVVGRIVPAILAVALIASCASRGEVRSGASAVYSTGLSVTLLSWKDRVVLSQGTAQGRWLTTDVRVDYDGNAPFAEVPAEALKLLWEAPDGSKSGSSSAWVYDPTPGLGWTAKAEVLRVRMSNRFTLAFDLPKEAVPHSFLVGDKAIPLTPPAP